MKTGQAGRQAGSRAGSEWFSFLWLQNFGLIIFGSVSCSE